MLPSLENFNVVKIKQLAFLLAAALLGAFCHPAKKTTGTPGTPPGKTKPSDRPKYEPMDTVRWSENPNDKPPIHPPGYPPNETPGGDFSGQKFRIALLLPFLTKQADTMTAGVPDKSHLALQFYAGAKIALEQLSTEEGMNLTVDVFDTQLSDADFEKTLAEPKLDLAQVCLGPIRSSHVSALARWTKMRHKILVSPESPNPDLTSGDPRFIQLNPSLRAHCEAITKFILRKHTPDEVVLVCKQKESERLAFFQNANSAGGRFQELIVPDATETFAKIDLAPYFRAGKTTVFVVPSWTSQDFVFGFFRRVQAQQGRARVEIFGMPQWTSFENIEADYFQALNVHVSAASFADFGLPKVKAFQEKFYAATGTIPDDDAFNGYDATLFTGRMLKKFGLDFPRKLGRERAIGLARNFQITPAGAGPDAAPESANYLENSAVHILKFENFRFVPAN